ncbi:MAG: PilT/PilU family type 4a pilus ATPase [Victivallales bacterium]|nr:PilT/PilU family type 4a pilus ATPase [Victivallales bacterium]
MSYSGGGAGCGSAVPSGCRCRENHAMNRELTLDYLLRYFVASGASDLHLTAATPPYLRLNGELVPGDTVQPVAAVDLERLTRELVGEQPYEKFKRDHELDMALSFENTRLRINLYRQQGAIAWALRALPESFIPLEQLGLPPPVTAMACQMKKGLVLVTGATGSGKSTTLASIINQINVSRSCHIFTIEDPIEYRHANRRAFISQREIGSDAVSFPEALRRILREDPDVVLIGEMRDRETMSAALTLAETGHLTFATLHTASAVQTVSRLIGAFPANEQDQIRTQLATTLSLVLSQQLIPRQDRPGRSMAAEILVATPALKAMIRENKLHQMLSLMQTGAGLGMRTMNQALAELWRQQQISREAALAWSWDKEDLIRTLAITPAGDK